MTEQKNRRDWTPDEEVKHQLELAEQRAQWERNRAAEAEQRKREEKQARLGAYLKRRGEAYLDHTGSPPPQHVLEGWQMDYLSEVEAEEQREREAKLKAAEQEHYSF
jgi:hypothetical protein